MPFLLAASSQTAPLPSSHVSKSAPLYYSTCNGQHGRFDPVIFSTLTNPVTLAFPSAHPPLLPRFLPMVAAFCEVKRNGSGIDYNGPKLTTNQMSCPSPLTDRLPFTSNQWEVAERSNFQLKIFPETPGTPERRWLFSLRQNININCSVSEYHAKYHPRYR